MISTFSASLSNRQVFKSLAHWKKETSHNLHGHAKLQYN